MTTIVSDPPVARSPKWWETAENPPCQLSGCVGHKPGTFALGAGMVCIWPVLRDGAVRVDVDQCTWGDDLPVGEINVDPRRVYIEIDTDNSFDLDEAERVGTAILEAVRLARTDGHQS